MITPWALRAARAVAAAGLGVDAYVHLNLASLYAEGGGTINEGLLFRAEAAVAILAALAIAVSARRAVCLAALAVAASAVAVMLVARYVDVGVIGPFPDFYDPVWFPEKLLAAYAEGAAAVAALGAVLLPRTARQRPPGPARRTDQAMTRSE
ncbi:MAG: hypothetical protein J2P35_11815 [Actinobacteria bacterium]|nr:hypothetical protein [Actinomycetota bacterium]